MMFEWFAFVSPHFLQQSDFIDVLILESTIGVIKNLIYHFYANSLHYLELDLLFYEFLCILISNYFFLHSADLFQSYIFVERYYWCPYYRFLIALLYLVGKLIKGCIYFIVFYQVL